MKILAAVLILLFQVYPPGQDDFPQGPGGEGTPPPPVTACPCWDAADFADPAVWGRACGTELDPDVAALCALGYVWETCTVGAPGTLLYAQWSAGASTCALADKDFAPVSSAAGLTVDEVNKCISEAAAGVAAMGIGGCTPS